MADLGDESGHFTGVLDALRRFDAARDVDAPRVYGTDCTGHIALVQTAGKDQRPAALRGSERPVEALPDAAVLRHEAVEQPCRGARQGAQVRQRSDSGPYTARLDQRQAELRAEIGRLGTMEPQ